MDVNEYKLLRGKYTELTTLIFRSADFKKEIIPIAKIFGFYHANTLVFDSESDSDYLADYFIFEHEKNGVKTVDYFFDESEALGSLEEELLESMINQRPSLYELTELLPQKNIVVLKDILNPSTGEFELVDMGLSQTGKKGLLFYSRLLPIRNVYITSGVTFLFRPVFKQQILNGLSFLKFKKGRNFKSSDMYKYFCDQSKILGEKVHTQVVH